MLRFALLFAATAPSSALTLPTHLASSMVLQRDAPIEFWGRDTPGSTVAITYRGVPLPPATTDAAGRFAVALPPLALNATPDSIAVRSSQGGVVMLSDVVIGDVFVCVSFRDCHPSNARGSPYHALTSPFLPLPSLVHS